jgi:hypothetical protein
MKNIHLIPTDKPSRLSIESNELILVDRIGNYKNAQHIYITSDEEIKEGDWYLNPRLNTILICNSSNVEAVVLFGVMKIILTTDQDLINNGVQTIDDNFLEWFVKNPSCEFVKIGSHQEPLGEVFNGKNTNTMWTDPKYKIIIPQEEKCSCKPMQPYNNACCKVHGSIPKEEPNLTHWLDELPNMDKGVLSKMWKGTMPKLEHKTNLEKLPFPKLVEECVEYYKTAFLVEEHEHESLEDAAENYWAKQPYNEDAFIEGAKWQAEKDKQIINSLNDTLNKIGQKHIDNLFKDKPERMYSEEEVVELLHSRMRYTLGEDYKEETTMGWFEAFKKK